MRKYPLMSEIISMAVIFFFLTNMSGCYSTKTISKSDIPLPESSKYSNYPYLVHFDLSSFMLEEPTVSNGLLSGTVTQIDKKSFPDRLINIYLKSDSMAKIDNEGILSVPVDEIKEVKVEGPDATKTTLLATYGVVAVVAGVLLMVGVGYAFYMLLTIPG